MEKDIKQVMKLNNRENKLLAKIKPKPEKPKLPPKPKPQPQPKPKQQPKPKPAKQPRKQPSNGKDLPRSRSVVPNNVVNPSDRVDKSFDNFVVNASPYLQTLLRPALVTGVGIPEGDYASIKWSVSWRISGTADASGNFWFTLGVGRATDATHWSSTNACSLCPNRFNSPDTGGVDRSWIASIGNMLSPGSTMDLTDVFKASSATTTINMPSAPNNFSLGMIASRPVSASVSINPLGNVSGSQGSLYAGQFSSDLLDPSRVLDNLSVNEFFVNQNGSIMMPMNRLTGGSLIYKPCDQTDLEYKRVAEDFVFLPDHPDLLTSGMWFIMKGGIANQEVEIVLHINYESLPADSSFTPGLSEGHDDVDEQSLTWDALAKTPMFSPETYDIVGGGASGSGSVNHIVNTHMTWHPQAVATPTRRLLRGVQYCGKPPALASHNSDGGATVANSGFRPFLKKLFTDYLPIAMKFGAVLAPLL